MVVEASSLSNCSPTDRIGPVLTGANPPCPVDRNKDSAQKFCIRQADAACTCRKMIDVSTNGAVAALFLCVVNEELWPAKTTTTGDDFTSCVLAAS